MKPTLVKTHRTTNSFAAQLAQLSLCLLTAAFTCLSAAPLHAQTPASHHPPTTEGDFIAKNFTFRSGEKLPELRLHYTTLGSPHRDAQGHVDNAVLILHGTGGSGHQFLSPFYANELFNPGQLLDAAKYFIILPDGIGHGKSSKPSDGLRAHFPHYDYDDMIAAQHLLLTDGLKVDHLRLVTGTSMGCMHSFVWGETYPDFMDALMPLACLPVQIAGRNRLWRRMAMEAITSDPAYKGGDYTEEPTQAMQTWIDFLLIAGSAPLHMQQDMPTRDAVDKYLEEQYATRTKNLDANDILYQVASSRNYDPSPKLETIKVPVMWINSADDFINPPELGIAEREVKRMSKAKFILLPASLNTFGHGTHTHAAVWQQYLADLLRESAH